MTGTSTLNGLVITNNSFTSNSQSTFTKVPTLAHVFAPAWPLGTSNASDGTIYINPASSVADGNLISAAVGGAIKFLVDTEGDIYANNLILAGSTTSGATTIAGNLTVQDNTVLGDAATDLIKSDPLFLREVSNFFMDSRNSFAGGRGAVIDNNGDFARIENLLAFHLAEGVNCYAGSAVLADHEIKIS